MSLIFTLKLFFAAVNVLFGIVTLLQPQRAMKLIGLEATNKFVVAEVRIGWGGLYLALGLGALVLRLYPTAFLMFSFAYMGMALTRIVTGVIDRSLWNRVTVAALIFEVVCAVIFLVEA